METRSAVLVTGAAGDIGQTIIRILRSEYPGMVLIGADVKALPAELQKLDHQVILPPARDARYLTALEATIRQHAVSTLLPGSEAELAALLSVGWLEGAAPAGVIAANARAVEVGLDKLETNRALRDAGLPVPWTTLVEDGPPPEFPCILKPRRGQGSKGLELVQGMPDAKTLEARRGDIFQQWLPDAEAEYTCGLYRSRDGEVRTVSLRRKLRGGLTGSAEVAEVPAIDEVLNRIAIHLELQGSINVQLRMLSNVPMVFEVNPRFSSTVGFRHEIGFKDLMWSLLEAEWGSLPAFQPPRRGLRFERPT